MAMSVIIGMACHLMGSAEQWRAVGLGPKVSDISNGTHVHASYSFENLHRRKPLIIAMSLFGHSMGFAATLGGDVLAVLELERYHKIRYFDLRVLTGMNENFRNIGHLCESVMDHRQQSCIERLTSMEPEPDEDDASFEIRAMKQREKVLYENAMERYTAEEFYLDLFSRAFSPVNDATERDELGRSCPKKRIQQGQRWSQR